MKATARLMWPLVKMSLTPLIDGAEKRGGTWGRVKSKTKEWV